MVNLSTTVTTFQQSICCPAVILFKTVCKLLYINYVPFSDDWLLCDALVVVFGSIDTAVVEASVVECILLDELMDVLSLLAVVLMLACVVEGFINDASVTGTLLGYIMVLADVVFTTVSVKLHYLNPGPAELGYALPLLIV